MKLFYEVGYRYFRMPWDMGPRLELVELVESGRIRPCRTIDLGCGTGSNAIFLAQHGFEVTGLDYAASAIEKARVKAEAAGVTVHFVVDDLTDLRHINGTFDFLVDYGTLDDLSHRDRDLYVRNMLPLTHSGSRYLLWCFEWPLIWWEQLFTRFLPFGALALAPGEAEQRFAEHFEIEHIAGAIDFSQWPRGFGCYLMTRTEK